MAIPTQGGLGQASAQAKPPAPAATKFDVDAAQAENLETEAKSTAKTPALDDLGGQREAMNEILMRLRAGLDTRKNRMFDPVLMQAAAGFLKPTKTGSFGESLGYAAEGAGAASEREMVQERENQKMEMELAAKEMEFRQQLGGDAFVKNLMDKQRGAPAAPAAMPAVGSAAGLAGAPSAAAPQAAAAMSTQSPEQILNAAREGRIPITDEILLVAQQRYPKMFPALKEIRATQDAAEKNRIERAKLESTTRKVKPLGGLTEREMDKSEYSEYLSKVADFERTGDEQKLLKYYMSKGWLEGSQLRGYRPEVKGEAPAAIPRAKSPSELASEEASMTQLAKTRSEASEARGNLLLSRGENAPNMQALASDVLSLTDSNTKAFNLMQNATVRDSLLRAIEQGASATAGPMTVALNLPVRVALQGNKEYQLTKDDIAALQLFQQKQSAITAEMRKMARTPGEGATDKAEGQLYAAIGMLPTDSAKVLALKSEAMIQRARYDERAAELWSQFQEDNPNKSFTYFQQNQPDFKELRKNYVSALNDMREKNADTLRTSPKVPAPKPAASAPAPARTPSDNVGNSEIPAKPAPASAKPLPPTDSSVPAGYIRDPKTGVIRKKREGE